MADEENNHDDIEIAEPSTSDESISDDESDDEEFDDAVDDWGDIDIVEVAGEHDDDEQDTSQESQQDDDDDSNDHNFDPSLPVHHQYLGSNLEEFTGRTVFEEDQVVQLPILRLPSLVLFPGELLPLHFYMPNQVNMVRNLFRTNRTLGVVNLKHSNQQCRYGTTAEIISVHADELEGGVSVKSIGRQRFYIKSTRRQSDGILLANVEIMKESSVTKYPAGFVISKPGCRNRALSKYKNLSPHPSWLYEMYNEDILIQRIKKELLQWNNAFNLSNLPDEPTRFSYKLANGLPLDDNIRVELLTLNCTVYRLQKELDLICRYTMLSCSTCQSPITDKKNIFSMSMNGPMSSFVNPGGYVHDTFTVRKVSNIVTIGQKSLQYSWFPGYAWTIAQCSSCHQHMGWKFTATKHSLNPKQFYGLTRSSVQPVITLDSTTV
ncbi:Protein cereblon [Trichoplax sp. H2]|nr:Protein cereblon [Trichoplax sp. H2]|eukprot:RDD39935.1 Protein cereblon [Trichoplax sp. H2]